ncbi:MAG: methyltransferase domain-containing protein [Pseudomonadota bacterium]|nr:methyltransferase domain-containing protein [Pseudomonadota bacterium]
MWLDIAELQDFYDNPLGQMASRIISRHIREIWPDVTGMSMLGLGYSVPYLNMFLNEASNIIAAKPASEGANYWSDQAFGQTIITDETELPLEDLSIERVVLIHGAEFSEAIRPMMREIWRILSNNGRLMIIVPNRRGVWARFERTPFGHGRPYSKSQLIQLLGDTLFTPTKTNSALFMPPTRLSMLISSAAAWENIGRHWLGIPGLAVGGVISIEAKKQIYAVTPNVNISRQRGYVTITNQ